MLGGGNAQNLSHRLVNVLNGACHFAARKIIIKKAAVMDFRSRKSQLGIKSSEALRSMFASQKYKN